MFKSSILNTKSALMSMNVSIYCIFDTNTDNWLIDENTKRLLVTVSQGINYILEPNRLLLRSFCRIGFYTKNLQLAFYIWSISIDWTTWQ